MNYHLLKLFFKSDVSEKKCLKVAKWLNLISSGVLM